MDYGLQSPGFRITRKKFPRFQIPQAKFYRIPDFSSKVFLGSRNGATDRSGLRTNHITPSIQRMLIVKILTCSGIVSGIPCEHIENELVLTFARNVH